MFICPHGLNEFTLTLPVDENAFSFSLSFAIEPQNFTYSGFHLHFYNMINIFSFFYFYVLLLFAFINDRKSSISSLTYLLVLFIVGLFFSAFL